MKVSFVWFDIGYTLLYMQREVTYRQALKDFGVEVSLEDIERAFHLTDKLFMREYPGIFLKPRKMYMPSYLGIMNYRLGVDLDVIGRVLLWGALLFTVWSGADYFIRYRRLLRLHVDR